MKIADGLKLIENGWIRKPKGFRVSYHRQTEAGVEAGLSPPPEAAPLNSDVTAWRYAWKLWRATQAAAETGEPGAPFTTLPWWTTRIDPSDSMAAVILRLTTRNASMMAMTQQLVTAMKTDATVFECIYPVDRRHHVRMCRTLACGYRPQGWTSCPLSRQAQLRRQPGYRQAAPHRSHCLRGREARRRGADPTGGSRSWRHAHRDQTDDYLHVEFKSKLMGFVDDVEFYFPDSAVIHMRSASRVGYSDFGVNRRRLEKIRKRFQNRLSKDNQT
jgi:hypothetical protein